MRPNASWGGTVALILRDMEPEARMEFEARMDMWTRISQDTVNREDSHPEDREAAQSRLTKLLALREHLGRELASKERMRQWTLDMTRHYRGI